MTEATPEPKQALVELIDAYAAAKTTNNEALIRLSVSQLQGFLAEHAVIPAPKKPAKAAKKSEE